MAFISEWVTNIILFILLAIIVDLLLPNTNMQRYAKMVIGLLLIAIILSPILKLFSADIEKMLSTVDFENHFTEKNTEILIENKKKEIQASQRAYILEQMAVHMERQVKEELVASHGYEVKDIFLEVDPEMDYIAKVDDLGEVQVTVKQQHESEKDNEGIQEVKAVSIDTTKPLVIKPEQETNLNGVKSYLSESWGVPEEKITVFLEGGEM